MTDILRLLALLLLTTAACSSCAGTNVPTEPPKVLQDTGVALFTPMGFGRGCPVNNSIITARHVVKKYNEPGFYDAWWSDRYGRGGYATLVYASSGVDGAGLNPIPGVIPINLPVGGVTEDLYFFDYDFETAENAFDSVLKETKLIRKIGGHIIFDVAPSRGSSGGCLFNSRDEAVGVVVWRIPTEEDVIGVGLQFPKEWR